MKRAVEVSDDDGWPINNDAFGIIMQSSDAMEGAIAFAEKRAPNWQGK
jgi:enoyl-CoA hydratase